MSRPELGTLLRHIQHLAGPCAPAEASDRELLARFAARREEAAFAALVQRHGPLVLNVCRRLLRQEQDAEDVFQATFLVLARKASSVRWRESVAPWLHAVAHRLALKARAELVRRRRQEREAAKERPARDAGDLSWREATALLEEELGRLPERYRAPLLLCCWEGKARDEAARLLGWTVGAFKGRLERGRELLRQRLARRGVMLSAGLLAVGLARGGVPAVLTGATVRLALGGGAEVVPPTVAALAGAGLSAARAKMVGAVLAVLLLAAGAGVWTQTEWMGRPVEEARADEAPAPPAPQEVAGEQPAAAPPAPAEKAPAEKPPEEAPPDEKPPAPLPWPRNDGVGDPLPAGVAQRFGTTRLRHPEPVHLVALASDGSMIASAGGTADPWVHLWDAKTGKELHRFQATVLSLAFSPDGRELAASGAAQDKAAGVILWNTKNGERQNVLKGDGAGKARFLAFSADCTRLWALDGTSATLWDTGKGGKLLVKGTPLRDPRALAGVASAGGGAEHLAVAGQAGIHILNGAGKELGVLENKGRTEYTAVASRDDLLAGGTARGEFRVWQLNGVKTPLLLKEWNDLNGKVMALTFVDDGKGPRLTSASAGTEAVQVCVWDPKKAKELSRVALDGSPKYGGGRDLPKVLLSADGKRVMVVDGVSQRLRLWDAATGKELSAANGHERAVSQVAFLPDGKTIASVAAGGVLLWPIGTDERPRRIAESAQWGNAIAISPDGKSVAILNHKGRGVEVRDTTSGKVQREIRTADEVLCVAFAPDGKSLALGTQRGAQLLTPTAEEPRGLGAERGLVTAIAFSPDGKLVAAAQPDGLHLWDVARGEHLRTLGQGPAPWVQLLAFDPAGRVLAAGAAGNGNAVALYDVATGGELRKCRWRGAGLQSLAFARGGRLLVVGEADGLTLWETASATEVLRLTGHSGPVNAIAVSPDGNRLVTGGADTTVLLWDLAAAWKETAPQLPAGKAGPSRGDLWRTLRSDGRTAYRAIWALAADRNESLYLVKQELADPGKAAQREEVSRLVADLDSADAKVRARAIRELRRIGPPADAALRMALAAAKSDKLQARLRAVIADLESEDQFTPDQHTLHASRVVDLLELIGTAEARKLLEALARDGATWALQQEAKAALARRPPPRPPAP